MRLITKLVGLLSFFSMTASVAVAQPESGKVYKICNIHDGYTFGENASGTLQEQTAAATETATQLWLAVAEPGGTGRFAFVNASSGKCLNSGSAWTSTKNGEYFYIVEKGTQAANATYGAGQKYYNISTNASASGSTCLHCFSNTSPRNHSGDGPGSRWTFVEATGISLSTINSSLATTLTELSSARTTYKNFANTCGVTVNNVSLQATDEASGNYISCNAVHVSNNADGTGCPGLLDGDKTTYLHTRYDGTPVNEYHYLQLRLSQAASRFRIRYSTRSDNNYNRPKRMVISGSNDGTNFTEITVLTSDDYSYALPISGSGALDFTSRVICTDGTAYNYIRFTVTETSNGATFNNYPFFTLSEFAFDRIDLSENTSESGLTAVLAFAAANAERENMINSAQGEETTMSAIYLPAYYTRSDIASLYDAAVTGQKIPGDGILENQLTLIDYYVYHTDESGVKRYLQINPESHALEVSTTPAAFRLANGATSGGYATKSYIMTMNGFHPGHWDPNASMTDPNSDGNTYTSLWHAQVLYYDGNQGKFAIRGTNVSGGGYNCDYFFTIDTNGNLSASNTLGQALYQWTIQPAYPFTLNTQRYFLKIRNTQATNENKRHLKYIESTTSTADDGAETVTSVNKIGIVNGENITEAAYWLFKEQTEHGRYYLNLVPVAADTKVISYNSETDGAGKLSAQLPNASGYNSKFVLEYTGESQAPYLLRTASLRTYMSNYAGVGNYMGFYNSATDPGSRLSFTPVISTGKFYRLKGNSSQKYMDASGINNANIALKVENERSKSGSIFYLTEDSKLLSYSEGKYLYDTHSVGAIGAANGNTLIIYPSQGALENCYTLYTNNSEGGKYVHDNTSAVDRYREYAEQCNWQVENVTSLPVSISNTVCWSTFYAPAAVRIPADVTAYIATIEGSTCTLTKVTGTIPANTGLILYKHGGGEVEFEIVESGLTVVTANSLTGGVESGVTAPENTYALQQNRSDNSKVGLYSYTGTLKGFRAFYVGTTSNVRGYIFQPGGEATAIDRLFGDHNDELHIYDLSGRRVTNPTEGIYIINGRKVFFKK